jgi:hypothetical protein
VLGAAQGQASERTDGLSARGDKLAIAETRALRDYGKWRENAHAVWQDALTADSPSVR